MRTVLHGASVAASTSSISIFLTTSSMPPTTLPNATQLSSRSREKEEEDGPVLAVVVMKNCELFVLGPAFAIETMPDSSCSLPN